VNFDDVLKTKYQPRFVSRLDDNVLENCSRYFKNYSETIEFPEFQIVEEKLPKFIYVHD
jgi:hypothetical protein